VRMPKDNGMRMRGRNRRYRCGVVLVEHFDIKRFP